MMNLGVTCGMTKAAAVVTGRSCWKISSNRDLSPKSGARQNPPKIALNRSVIGSGAGFRAAA